MLQTEPAVPNTCPPVAQQCRHAANAMLDQATDVACLTNDVVSQLSRDQQFRLHAELAGLMHQLHQMANWVCDVSNVPERNR
jgi:hypothetical protein